jgi:hypothetical protein
MSIPEPDRADPDRTQDLLEQAGFALHALTEEQQEVMRGISEQELELLLDLKTRLDLVGPEVEAHSEFAGGALF